MGKSLIYIFAAIGALTVFFLLIFIFFKIFYGAKWRQNVLSRVILGRSLKNDLVSLANEYPSISKQTLAKASGSIINRLTRPIILGLLIAIIPSALLVVQISKMQVQNELIEAQNIKIDQQTNLFEKQNENIDIQNNLLETNRRSSLVFLMSNILDKLDEEIKDLRNISSEKSYDSTELFSLSDNLIGRIIALSRAFKPYKILEDGQLSEKKISPERGQLFISLIKAPIDSISMKKICVDADFSSADIGKITILNKNLSGINLSESIMPESHFDNVILKDANLSGINLSASTIYNTNLQKSILERSYFVASAFLNVSFNEAFFHSSTQINHTNILNSKFDKTDLVNVSFEDTEMRNNTFINSSLWGTVFCNSNIKNIDFYGADMTNGNFDSANLERVSFSNTNIIYTTFNNSSLTLIDFSNSWVETTNWLNILKRDAKHINENILYDFQVGEKEFKNEKIRKATIRNHYKILRTEK